MNYSNFQEVISYNLNETILFKLILTHIDKQTTYSIKIMPRRSKFLQGILLGSKYFKVLWLQLMHLLLLHQR